MNPKFENMLRKGMTAFGHTVESVIGQAKKAKGSVAQTRGVEPILALEGQLPLPKIKELISISVDRVIKPLIPNLIDRATLEISEGEMKFCPIMKDRGASVSVFVDISGVAASYVREKRLSNVHTVRAAAKNIPFEDGFFDFVVASLATSAVGDISRVIKEVGRQLAIGGNAIIADFHPFGCFAKKGPVRLRALESVIHGVEDYYKICKLSGFQITYIKEIFLDENLRSFFVTPEEKASFRSIKDTPFLIFIMVTKKDSSVEKKL